jgi:hypothetical protein
MGCAQESSAVVEDDLDRDFFNDFFKAAFFLVGGQELAFFESRQNFGRDTAEGYFLYPVNSVCSVKFFCKPLLFLQ